MNYWNIYKLIGDAKYKLGDYQGAISDYTQVMEGQKMRFLKLINKVKSNTNIELNLIQFLLSQEEEMRNLN